MKFGVKQTSITKAFITLMALALVVTVVIIAYRNVNVSAQSIESPQPPSDLITIEDITGVPQYIVNLKTPEVGGPDFDPNVPIAEIVDEAQDTVIERNSEVLDDAQTERYNNIPAFTAVLEDSEVKELEDDPLVESVAPNAIRFTQLDRSVPWINSDDVASSGFDGEGTAVAILDTGVSRHQFVNIVSEGCYSNANGFGGGTSLCPDGVNRTTADGSAEACDFTGCDHGTHVAGIAAGDTDRTRVNLESSLAEVGQGNNVSLNLYYSTGGEAVSAADVSLEYDPGQFTFISFAESTAGGFTTATPSSPTDGTVELISTPTAADVNGTNVLIGTVVLNASGPTVASAEITLSRSVQPASFTIDGQAEKPSLGSIKIPIGASDVAGTLATSSSAAYNGVAPKAGVIAFQVFTTFSESTCITFYGYYPCLGAYDSDTNAALDRTLELHNDSGFTYSIAAANMSLGGGIYTTQSACDAVTSSYWIAIQGLRNVGIATVISSGNDSSSTGISAPGCTSNAIAVGSTAIVNGIPVTEQISSFSNGNSMLEILAPGSSIRSSVLSRGFTPKSGTSMAAPHITGVWAQMKQAVPDASVSQVLDSLTSTGVPLLDSRNGLTFPRVDTEAALNDITAPVLYDIIDGSTNEDGGLAAARFKLLTAPTHDVVIPISISDSSEAMISGGATTLTITPATWNDFAFNSVGVDGLDDPYFDQDVTYTLITGDPTSTDPVYDALTAEDVPDIEFVNNDNETIQSAEWDQVVPLDINGSNSVLYYSSNAAENRGVGVIANLGASQQINILSSSNSWYDGWSKMLPIDLDNDGLDEVLFYDETTGTAGFFNINSNGILDKTLSQSTWRAGWDIITPIEIDNSTGSELLFYDNQGYSPTRGLGAFYNLSSTGLSSSIRQHTSWSPDWSLITPTQLDTDVANELLFYISGTGAASHFWVNTSGGISPLSSSTYRSGWDVIESVNFDGSGSEELYFYDKDGYSPTRGVSATYRTYSRGLGASLTQNRFVAPFWDITAFGQADSDSREEIFLSSQSDLFTKVYDTSSVGGIGQNYY